MASSGWQGDVTLQSGGFGYDYFKGNLRVDSITHSGDTVTVSGAFGVHNAGVYESYYVFPINAAVNGSTGYQQVVAGNQHIAADAWVTSNVSFSFSASAAATSANIEVLWNYNNGTASNSITYTLYFDASITAPTGLNVTNVSAGQNTVKGNVSVSGWGGGGDASTRYRELQVWAGNMSGDRRYQPTYGDATSGEITCSNSSSGALTITPNTQYWIGGYASNGIMSTGSQPFGTIITKVPNVGGSIASTTDEAISFNWSIANQGGARDIRIDYKVGSGDWAEATTVSGSGAKSGSYDITGLTPNTAYSVMLRSAGVGGSVSGGTTLSANTLPADPAIELTCTTRDSIVLGYLVEQQGGNETIYLEYKADGSNDWIVGATISTAGSFNGTITISGLAPNTSYTYTVRARSSGGWTSTPETITATTRDITSKIYCPVNGIAKRVTKIYFPWKTLVSVGFTPNQWIIGLNPITFVQRANNNSQINNCIGEGGEVTTLQIKSLGSGGNLYWQLIIRCEPVSGPAILCVVDTANSMVQAQNMLTAWGIFTQQSMVPVQGSSFQTNFVNAQYESIRKNVKKVYASVNGQAKLVWEEA